MVQRVVSMIGNQSAFLRWGLLGAVPLLITLLVFRFSGGALQNHAAHVPTYRMEVKRVVSGHSIKVEPDERLNYAGIRTPYKHEPLHKEAQQRNTELVDGKKVRVRYDEAKRNRKGRLLAYVSVDGQLVNETLVREGLAYVRLTPGTRRFADLLLAAQADARKRRKGIWLRDRRSSEKKYLADPKYGNYHRPNCREVPKINPQRLISFGTKRRAIDAGFAPCPKCLP